MTSNLLEDFYAPLPRPWTYIKPGSVVEIRRLKTRVRQGIVETVMPDGSGFGIEPHGLEPRMFVDTNDETVVVWG
jgi:hypothetical protein